ncbi:hypothetical protein O3M35_000234 [Rhynocoris fuscipes]|uniref:Uncharacterized protein n=1 Tax=Rhynocoris fuscipes TaxID=488301 RepID=A0AAW1DNP7_9HEMI
MKLFLSVLLVITLVENDVLAAPKPFLSSLLNGGANLIKNQVDKGAEAFGKVMTLGKDVTTLGTGLTSKASYMGSAIGKVGLSSLTTFGNEALNTGADLGVKGLDFMKKATEGVPIIGTKVAVGADLGKLGIDLSQAAGKNVLDLVNSVGLGGLTAGNTLAQLTSGGLENAAGLGFGLSQKGAEAGAKIINTAVDKSVGTLTGLFGRQKTAEV